MLFIALFLYLFFRAFIISFVPSWLRSFVRSCVCFFRFSLFAAVLHFVPPVLLIFLCLSVFRSFVRLYVCTAVFVYCVLCYFVPSCYISVCYVCRYFCLSVFRNLLCSCVRHFVISLVRYVVSVFLLSVVLPLINSLCMSFAHCCVLAFVRYVFSVWSFMSVKSVCMSIRLSQFVKSVFISFVLCC